MRTPQLLMQRACSGVGGTQGLVRPRLEKAFAWDKTWSQRPRCIATQIAAPSRSISTLPQLALRTSIRSHLSPHQTLQSRTSSRLLSASSSLSEAQPPSKSYVEEQKEKGLLSPEEQEVVDEDEGFKRSDKANAASQLNLSARLSKEGSSQSGGWREVWRLIKVARPELGTLGWAFLFLLFSSAVSMSIPFSIGRVLDIATGNKKGGDDGGEGTADTLFGFSLPTFYTALGGIFVLGASANFGRILLLRIVGERIVARLRSRLYKRTFTQNAEFFDANRVGDLISRLGSDTIIVAKSITQNMSDGLRSGISGMAGFGAMLYVSPKLTAILLLFFPPIAIGAALYGRFIRNLSRKIQSNLGTLTKIAEERLGNVRTSQAFAGEVQEVARYNRQVKRIFTLGRREATVAATFFGASGMMGNLTILALLYVGGGMVKSGAISIGELSSFMLYTAYAGSSMFGLSGFYSELMKGVGAASRLFELQDREPTIHPTVGQPIKSLRGPIEFKNVSFSYPTRPAVTIFKDLNFRIEAGMNVAIVAPSGGGKSTIASLLLRFYTPNSGTITIDGKDITTLNAKQLRRKIGFVGQEPVLFSGTIAENIAYGRPHATRQEIVAAARQANCGFIGDFPDGLETPVGARGTQLSGGQKQRIAIARALLKNPDILILDEATSALDAESETLVNQALARLLAGNNTTISIAHRLSTIKRSDRIIVISGDGTIAEEGTYKELSNNPDGAFSKLMEWQMSSDSGTGPRSTPAPKPTEEEEVEADLEGKDGEDFVNEEGTKVRKGDKTSAEAVLEKAKPGDRFA